MHVVTLYYCMSYIKTVRAALGGESQKREKAGFTPQPVKQSHNAHED